MKIDIFKPLYCIDKETKKKHLVESINFPLDKPSGKDLTIEVEDNLLEWRSIRDVEILKGGE